MTRIMRPTWLVTGALVLLAAAAACSRDTGTGPASTSGGGTGGTGGTGFKAPVTFRLNLASSSSTVGGSASGIIAKDDGPGGEGDFGDGEGHHWHGWWGWMRLHNIDSLTAIVTKLEVFGDTDTENAADSVADSVSADSARRARGDSDEDDDGLRDWEQHERGWITIPVDSAAIDLIHLPDSAAVGIKIATGTLPAGTYRRVRLFIVNPLLYLDSTVVTPNGDTLQAGVGLPVIFPNADSTGATFKTDDPFTVAAVGDTVPLFFDRDDTVRHIIITGSGKIIVLPSFHKGRDRH